MTHGRFITVAGVLAVLIVAALAATWIRLDIEFTRPCRIFPRSEWVLLQTQPDTFEARLTDYRTGSRPHLDLYRFERGDLVRFRLASDLGPGSEITASQDVARFESQINRRTLDELGPMLAEAEANLQAAQTGEREEVIALARSEIAAAQADRDQLAAEYERAQTMLEQDLSSRALFDVAQANYRRAEANLEAARNRLRVAQVGEKEAVVRAWQARCDLLRRQIADARARLEADRVTCPIAGEIVAMHGDSALVRVAALDTLYAVAPVSPSRATEMAPGQEAVITPLGVAVPSLTGRVAGVDRQAAAVAGRSFYWVTVAVPNPDRHALGGLRASAAFKGPRVTLLDWVRDRLAHTADRTLGG